MTLPQFTIRRLLLNTALLAAGVGAISSLDRSDRLAASSLVPVFWFGGGALIGAGIFSFVRRPILGAVIGAVGQLIVAIAIRLIR